VAGLRILVVSANPLARAGMAALLASMPGVVVLGADGPLEPASAVPDAALLDVGEAEPEQLEAIGRLAADLPGVPIVALATVAVRERVGDALGLGAAALLPVDVDPSTLRATLEAAQHGLVLVTREDLPALLPAEASVSSVTAPVEALTTREVEVLQWLARGLTNGQIAQRLHISEHTVKFHVASILGKLGARSRADAVARGIGLGWILV
jgi:DNA-binding NarL/FixJ family response regulator